MISVEGINKSFGPLPVLRDVSLEVGDGEFLAIVGPSGAGKTTLLQIMGTLTRPDSGKVLYDGKAVQDLSSRQQARFRNSEIGFVFQFHELMPEFTIDENVAMPLLIAGKSRRQSLARARELLERLGLRERLNHKPSELSGGERQRAAVARALSCNPKVILADEPTGSLDSRNRQEIYDLFTMLNSTDGTTLVVVTHDEGLASRASRTIHMADGRISQESRAESQESSEESGD